MKTRTDLLYYIFAHNFTIISLLYISFKTKNMLISLCFDQVYTMYTYCIEAIDLTTWEEISISNRDIMNVILKLLCL